MSDYCYDDQFSGVYSCLNEISEKLSLILEELKEKNRIREETSNDSENRQE